jgi:hypothetical protein
MKEKKGKLPGHDAAPLAGAIALIVTMVVFSGLLQKSPFLVEITKPLFWLSKQSGIFAKSNTTGEQALLSFSVGAVTFLAIIFPLFRLMRKLEIESMASKQRKADKINAEVSALKNKAKKGKSSSNQDLIDKYK